MSVVQHQARMSRPPDYMYRVSEALSEVMNDIGVNKRLVMKRRRAMQLVETIGNITPGSFELFKIYHFGSQTEGSTTIGLESDVDTLFSLKSVNVLQNMSEWKPGMVNLMMAQNVNTSPGYCHLQIMGSDEPLPANMNVVTDHTMMSSVTDSEGELLLKHTFVYSQLKVSINSQLNGPAITNKSGSRDRVFSYYCESTPHQVTHWSQKHGGSKWPTQDTLKQCRNAGCFVVPVGSKVHSPGTLENELEWRISTSLQERYLMFSLDITQLMCYILMKMILKTHISPYIKDVLTSFMCKNVLMFCIAKSSHDWYGGTLLSYLHNCLFMLNECIKQRNCPHFLIPENNLLAGHLTDGQRGKLMNIFDNLMKNDDQFLCEIEIDDLGQRLKMKLNKIPHSLHIPSAEHNSRYIHTYLVCAIANILSSCFQIMLNEIKLGSLEMVKTYLSQTCLSLTRQRNEGDLQQTACDLLRSLVCSILGSVIACIDIDKQVAVSNEAFTYLEAGKDSDVLSGRLKIVSALYCTGDMKRAHHELSIIKTQYNIPEVHSICGCYILGSERVNSLIKDTIEYNLEKVMKSHVAICTRFLQGEVNCVPHELRFEMLKSYIEEDRKVRTDEDTEWMDFITVDSIPYLFFLRYKTCGHLQRNEEKTIAFHHLAQSISIEPNLRHKETALNLLGQCLEQENMQIKALQCYIWSLKYRKRNNAARFLLCIQLYKLWKRDYTQ